MLKKKELLKEVAEKSSTTAKEVEAVIGGLTEVVKNELDKGEKVVITGLCTFAPKFVAGGEKTFRNVKTGESFIKKVDDKMVIKIKPDKSFAASIKVTKPKKK